MSLAGEPRRMHEDTETPEEFAAALRAEREHGPNDAELAELTAALGLAVIAPASAAAQGGETAASPSTAPPAATGPSAGMPATGLPTGTWVGGAAMLTAAVVAVGVQLGGDGPGEPPRPAERSSVTHVVETPAAPEDREPRPLPPLAPPNDSPIAPESAVSARPRPAPERPLRSAPPEDPNARIREEAALVDRAEASLASDPAAALRTADEHRRRFPNGLFGEEREVVAIDALIRLGRRADAERRAGEFQARHGRSVHGGRVRQLLDRSEGGAR